MAKAFISQNMGTLIEAYRYHPHHPHRISQEKMAEWLGVSQAQLSRYEHHSKSIDRLDRLRHFAEILRIPGQYLWFIVTENNRKEISPEKPATPAATVFTAAWDATNTARSAEEITRSDLVLSRRAALTGAAAIAVGPALIDPMQHWLIPAQRWTERSTANVISDEELVRLHSVTESMREWSRNDGLARKAIIGQLNELAERLRDAGEGHHTQQAFFLGAELAKIAAGLSWDAGLHDSAQRYYVLAVRMAKISGNVEFGALCLASMARQMFDLGRPVEGLDLVQLGQYGSRRVASPTLRALLHTREAWAYALMGKAQEFHRAVGQAQECFTARTTAGEPPWLSTFDEAELEGVVGARMRDLARFDPSQAALAESHIRRALVLRHPARVRNRIFDVIGLARTRLAVGEAEGACELINSVLPTARSIGSGRVVRKLRDFLTESAGYRNITAIRDVHDTIRTIA